MKSSWKLREKMRLREEEDVKPRPRKGKKSREEESGESSPPSSPSPSSESRRGEERKEPQPQLTNGLIVTGMNGKLLEGVTHHTPIITNGLLPHRGRKNPPDSEDNASSSRVPSSTADTDLVDYDDFASSSSSSLGSEEEELDGGHAPPHPPPPLISSTTNKSAMPFVRNEFDVDNPPCSSSSLRETEKIQKNDPSVPLQDAPSSTKGEDFEVTPPPITSDKYLYSGVGRHFGKKKTLSSLGVGGDCESLGGVSGVGGAPPGGAWCYGWLMRLRTVLLVFLGTLFVLSLASLLFVFPIIVDPILLGMEAHFSTTPSNCRSANNMLIDFPLLCRCAN